MGPNRFLVAVLAIAALATPAAADFTLTILHTNDFHSRIEPINKYDSACAAKDAAADKCFGGSARLITAIRERRAAAQHALLVDGGDQFQGSLFYSYYKGKAAAEMMNALGYDAMTVGNHEFDDGPEVLRGFMDAIGFPILLANADISREPSLAGVLLPATVIEVGGERIGLIGLTPEDTDELASPGPNVTFSDPAEALKREVARLTEAGIDKIVVLSHSGYAVDLRVAASVSGVDVIVGGHSHTYLSNVSDTAAGPYPTWVEAPDGNRVAIVQAYAYGKFLGELNVTWDYNGIVIAATGEPIIMDGQVAEDAVLKGRIAELAGPLEEIRHRVVAEAAAVIDVSGRILIPGVIDSHCHVGGTRERSRAIGHRMVAETGVTTVLDMGSTMQTLIAGLRDHGAGLNVAETAESLGKQQTNVKVLQHKGVQRLKRILVEPQPAAETESEPTRIEEFIRRATRG